MRKLLLLLSLFSLLSPVSVFAQDTSVTIRPKQVTGVDVDSRGNIKVDYSTSRVRFPSGKETFRTERVTYNPKKLLEMTKRGNPAQQALKAAALAAAAAAGYVINELRGQITEQEQPDPGYTAGYYWEAPVYGLPPLRGKTASEACAAGSVYGIASAGGTWCSRGTNSKYVQAVKRSCTNPPRNYSVCIDETVPMVPGEPLPLDVQNDIMIEAFNQLTPAQRRQFFEDLAGSPLITPELAEALQAEADRIRLAEGLESATVEETGRESATEENIQKVTVVDPIKIDETEVKVDAPTDDKYTRPEDYNPLTLFFGSLPDLPDFSLPDFGLSYSSSCRTITFDWEGASVLFPSRSQCRKLGEMKEITGWFISVITMFGIAWLILGNRKPGV
ncbi:hypothetical protein [Aliamphritea spongicola]|uniref:hypothetical protein n=1 Tax=Aliamphritea spongicola TaxID=707589 RepID=UPI00196B8206|nr:hypothetical protein [Aliamphritea spongicola]MBN3562517.1 hypothetical protein [Aliamphritea spongicola]